MSCPARLFLTFLGTAFTAFAQEAPPREKTTIWVAHEDGAIADFRASEPAVTRMVDALVIAVTGAANPTDAWRTLVRPDDRVGIKISAAGGPFFSSHPPLVNAIANGLAMAGVARKNILVWDRSDPAVAGFAGGNYEVRRIEPALGYDPKQIFSAPLMGKLIWGDLAFVGKKEPLATETPEQISSESHAARLLGAVTRIINVPVMSAHEGCGIAGALYNLTIPNLDNWRRFTTAQGAEYLPEIYADPRIRPKVALHIMDGLIAQYAGGPEFQPNYAFHHGTIYASRDPVALDANAMREIEVWRAQAQLPALGKRAGYLDVAAGAGLGNASGEAIELKPAR
jgi:hypothetical protein